MKMNGTVLERLTTENIDKLRGMIKGLSDEATMDEAKIFAALAMEMVDLIGKAGLGGSDLRRQLAEAKDRADKAESSLASERESRENERHRLNEILCCGGEDVEVRVRKVMEELRASKAKHQELRSLMDDMEPKFAAMPDDEFMGWFTPWEAIINACGDDAKNGYSESPIELIHEIIDQRDGAFAAAHTWDVAIQKLDEATQSVPGDDLVAKVEGLVKVCEAAKAMIQYGQPDPGGHSGFDNKWGNLEYAVDALASPSPTRKPAAEEGEGTGWRPAEGKTFYDGEMVLAAVILSTGDWEFHPVSAAVSEDPEDFALTSMVDGENWGWEWESVEWWMPIPELPTSVPTPPSGAEAAQVPTKAVHVSVCDGCGHVITDGPSGSGCVCPQPQPSAPVPPLNRCRCGGVVEIEDDPRGRIVRCTKCVREMDYGNWNLYNPVPAQSPVDQAKGGVQ